MALVCGFCLKSGMSPGWSDFFPSLWNGIESEYITPQLVSLSVFSTYISTGSQPFSNVFRPTSVAQGGLVERSVLLETLRASDQKDWWKGKSTGSHEHFSYDIWWLSWFFPMKSRGFLWNTLKYIEIRWFPWSFLWNIGASPMKYIENYWSRWFPVNNSRKDQWIEKGKWPMAIVERPNYLGDMICDILRVD
jgi:hypothetical protein